MEWIDFTRACPECKAYIPLYERFCPKCKTHVVPSKRCHRSGKKFRSKALISRWRPQAHDNKR